MRKLQPGHRLAFDGRGVRVEAYWTYPEPLERPPQRSDEEWTEILHDALDEAVESRLMSDVPLGAMLSGGLDSSLVVALMARRMAEPVKTFSVGFAGTPDNELGAARTVASAFGTDHHELELSLDDPIDLDALVWTLDEPLADLSSVGFGALSALASRHVKVALSGQKVGFFSTAVEHWLRSQVGGVVDDVLLDPGAAIPQSSIDPEVGVVPLLAAGKRSYNDSKFLLSVLMLELWLTRFLPLATTPTAVPSVA